MPVAVVRNLSFTAEPFDGQLDALLAVRGGELREDFPEKSLVQDATDGWVIHLLKISITRVPEFFRNLRSCLGVI